MVSQVTGQIDLLHETYFRPVMHLVGAQPLAKHQQCAMAHSVERICIAKPGGTAIFAPPVERNRSEEQMDGLCCAVMLCPVPDAKCILLVCCSKRCKLTSAIKCCAVWWCRWTGVLSAYVLRPSAGSIQRQAEFKAAQSWMSPIVGVHVRR